MKRHLHPLALTVLTLLFLVSEIQHIHAQTVDYGKSYFNVTKGLNGGTVEPGDTLEIRATIVVRAGAGTLDSCAFYDTIRAGTSYIAQSMAVLTNEGKIYKSFTDVLLAGDCGWFNAGNVRIHLGFVGAAQATAFRRGQLTPAMRPNVFGACVMVCSYRVRVTAALGSTINVGGGAITYKIGVNPIQKILYPGNAVAIYTNYGNCPNSIGVNALGTEFGGTFGSGKPRNRGVSGNVPASYTYNFFTTNAPGDYFYGIPNNTSTQTNYTILNNWAKPDPDPDGAGPMTTHRVFSVWDIIGDHTGATNPLLGNPAADTVANNNAGYMLVVNSSYRIDSAFQHTISGLCPNTYYEISTWMRNICSKCGNDSANINASSGNPSYIPTAPGDSSGVYPNVTFEVDGLDYYSTGNIKYTGQWVKKGFTYLTGPAQTSFALKFFNNAPGGGGNDWALDDISVATCTPNLNMLPSPTANVCIGNQVDIWCRVRCFFPNYIYWKWEKSTDNGATWTNTGSSGTGAPVMVGGNWEYSAAYPSFLADSSAHRNRYRIRVASTPGNLTDPNCSFFDLTTIIVWVNNCSVVLPTNFKAFSGQPLSGFARLQWEVENEAANIVYEVERSDDKIHFTKIGSLNGTAGANGSASYSFNDPVALSGQTYYRIKMTDGSSSKYSKILLLSNGNLDYEIRSLINPFGEVLSFELIAPENGLARISLMDAYGRTVKQSTEGYITGLNQIKLYNLNALPKGAYMMRVEAGDKIFNKSVIKAK